MKKIVIILSVFVLFVSGYGQTTQKQVETINEIITEQKDEVSETIVEENGDRKIEVNYNSNKELLDIILLLPDFAFATWNWKIEDRKKWYNEIKSNNFWIDKDTMFFNQIYFKPNTAFFQIVDGSWSVSIYETSDKSFIVITNDITMGDFISGTFEVKDNKIRELSFQSLFGNYREEIKLDNFAQECEEKFIDFEDPIFTFDLSDKNIVEIASSWYLTKEEFVDCLKGNAILYKFDPNTKKFEIDRIYWKPKRTN